MSHKTFRRRFLFSLRLHYVIFFFLTVYIYLSENIENSYSRLNLQEKQPAVSVVKSQLFN